MEISWKCSFSDKAFKLVFKICPILGVVLVSAGDEETLHISCSFFILKHYLYCQICTEFILHGVIFTNHLNRVYSFQMNALIIY